MTTWAIPWKIHLQREGGGTLCIADFYLSETDRAASIATDLSEVSCFVCLRLHYDREDKEATLRQAKERQMEQDWIDLQALFASTRKAAKQKAAKKREEKALAASLARQAKVEKPRSVFRTRSKKNSYTQADILKNMGLVYWTVERLLKRLPPFRRQDKGDLVSYGVLGLVYALEYWDQKLGFEFATYAVPCIKGHVLYGNSKMTKSFTPIHNRKYYGSLKGHYNDPVTSLEEALKQMSERSIYQSTWGSARGVGRWNAGGVREDHLHSPLPTPYDCATKSNLEEQTRKVLTTLTPREEKVIRMRFGIGEKSDHTLEEVGDDFEVQRERIRQIEAKALRKLRHPARAKQLRAFVEW